jgi:hypothetical protein
MIPGHEMQRTFPNPSSRGMARGASRFSPGQEMQHAFPTPGSRGVHHGALRALLLRGAENSNALISKLETRPASVTFAQ